MKVTPYEETHMYGVISIENNLSDKDNPIVGDFGIQIAEDGRVWICIDGAAFIRFAPTSKYLTQGGKLKGGDESNGLLGSKVSP